MLNRLVLLLIRIYQHTLSPDKWMLSPRLRWRICTHQPHCSQYATECFQKYSFVDALVATVDRIMSCTPSSHTTYHPSSYRIVFASWAQIGVPFLTAIEHDPRFDLVWVMTMPDAPRGRWMSIKPNIIASTVDTFHTDRPDDTVPLIKPQSVRLTSRKHHTQAKEAHQRLRALKPDFLVVVAYGKILPQELLDIPRIAPINVHWSLLPAYRWASPLQSVFLHWETHSWVTVMHMNQHMDKWDMIAKLKTPLPTNRTVNDLIGRIQDHAPAHLLDTLRQYGAGELTALPQSEEEATYCHKISKEDWHVDITSDSLQTIYRKYQAYALRPKVYFYWNEKRVIIEQISIDKDTYLHDPSAAFMSEMSTWDLHPAVTWCRVKPQGKKSIDRSEFLRWYLTQQ